MIMFLYKIRNTDLFLHIHLPYYPLSLWGFLRPWEAKKHCLLCEGEGLERVFVKPSLPGAL